MAEPRESNIGPWLVAIGAALWGTESAWRIPLNDLLAEPDVLVFWEHVVLVALALPFLLPRLREVRGISARAFGWLLFSGVAGSAVGAVFFSLALKYGDPTVINVVLNIQPVLSTAAAYYLFHDRLAPRFFVWAPIAVIAGILLVAHHPAYYTLTFDTTTGLFVLGRHAADFTMAIDAGVGYALVCALFWGLSTVAGRGVMVEVSLPVAASLRVVIGLISMTVIVAARGLMHAETLWPASARAHTGETALFLVLLATLSGGVPLVIYFQGLKLTRASTAGYFEMMQTLAAVIITWGIFGHALHWPQVVAAVVLVGAVAMVQKAQAATSLAS